MHDNYSTDFSLSDHELEVPTVYTSIARPQSPLPLLLWVRGWLPVHNSLLVWVGKSADEVRRALTLYDHLQGVGSQEHLLIN